MTIYQWLAPLVNLESFFFNCCLLGMSSFGTHENVFSAVNALNQFIFFQVISSLIPQGFLVSSLVSFFLPCEIMPD